MNLRTKYRLSLDRRNENIAELHSAIRLESLESLRALVPTVLGGNFINSALIVGFTWQVASHDLLLLWGAAVWCLNLFRAGLWVRFGRLDSPTEVEQDRQLKISVFTSGLSGLLWGGAPLLFFTADLTPHQLFLMFAAGGMAAGATATLSMHRPSYYSFVVPCLLMPALWYVAQAQYFHVMMGAMFTVYAAALVGVAINNRRMFVRAIRLRLELLKARDSAEAGSRAKNEFVSVVSHELRTPLTALTGSLGLLANEVAGELSSKSRELVDIATRNAQRLSRLIDDLLDMERMETGALRFSFENIELTRLVEQCVDANAAYGVEFGVSFEVVERAPETFVRADSDRLSQVMANLLSNAAKFSPRNSRVTIGSARRGDLVRVWVRDQGPGVPEEFKNVIFDRFTQADTTTSRDTGGAGLGLNISKSIVENHGGTIGFSGDGSDGTLFYFDLPMIELADGEVELLRAAS